MNNNVPGKVLDHDWLLEMEAQDRLPGPLKEFLEYGTAGRYSALQILEVVEKEGLDLAKDWPKIVRSICHQEQQGTLQAYGREHPQALLIAPRTVKRRAK